MGCGKKEKNDSYAPVPVSKPETLETVAVCYRPGEGQQQLLLTVVKTKDDAPISPNTTNSMLVYSLKTSRPTKTKLPIQST